MRPMSAIGSISPEDAASSGVKDCGIERHEENSQLGFRYDGSDSGDDAAWDCMLQLIRKIVDSDPRGPKAVAGDFDVSPSYLNHCLNERERHNVPAKWLPHLIKIAKDDDLIAFMALLRDRKLGPRVELTPAQKLDRVLTALSEQLGDDVRKLILDKAFRDR